MIIDFHTHIFPEKIAARTLSHLQSLIEVTPSMNGTIEGLVGSMKEANVDLSIVLPAMTSPAHFASVTDFAASVNEYAYESGGPHILSFGGIHPDSPDYKGQLQELKDRGFIGIKLHPDYQDTFIDDIRYLRIIERAAQLDMIILTHTGFDEYSPELVHCTTQGLLNVLREVAPPKFVLAHMGNHLHYDEVEKYLVGSDVYLDTAISIQDMDKQQFIRICKNHGTDKILFASDAPWTSQKSDVSSFLSMGFSPEIEQQILSENARKLLGI
ncbi:MAG: amidohydrolase family protein [Lachnospiraceae bacterium]